MSATKATRSSILNPALDFWLLGGFSLCLYIYLWISGKTPQSSLSSQTLTQFIYTGAFLQLAVNYPHFMASYHLAYRQGRHFILQHFFSLVVVPVFLICSFFWIYNNTSTVFETSSWALKFNEFIGPTSPFHFVTQRSSYSDSVGLLAKLMFFLVGWHYSKQVFGCAVWIARARSIFLTPIDFKVVKFLFISFWLLLGIGIQLGGNSVPYYDIQIPYLGFFTRTQSVLYYLALGTLILILGILSYRCWRHRAAWTDWASVLIAPASFLIWWHPFFYQKEFSGYGVPLFHSLQYLVFIAAVNRSEKWSIKRTQVTWAAWILVGATVFLWLPTFFDDTIPYKDSLSIKKQFYVVAFTLFINIHHYFIDSVIWKGPQGLGSKAMES